MHFLQATCLVLALNFFYLVQTQEVCDLEDVKCVTKRGENIYATLITGIRDVIEPIEPLYVDRITGVAEAMNYELTNVTLTGMKDCQVTQMKFSKNESNFEINLYCPHLVTNNYYNATGVFGSANVNGEGTAIWAFDKYVIEIKGEYAEIISEKYKKSHISIKSYIIKTYLKEKVILTHEALVHRDNDQSDLAALYVNNNFKTLENSLLSPLIKRFMMLFITRMKTYLTVFPIEKAFPKY